MEPKDSEGPGALVAGRYKLVARAGEGGMAEVWSAEVTGAEGFRKRVALKRIHSHLAHSETYRAMFVREACLAAELDHPNVVQVFDLGEDPAGLYLVMEWVQGVTLKDIAELCDAYGVRLTPALSAALVIEVLRGLEAAHGHQVWEDDGGRRDAPIIHRDVSPSNVLLTVSGGVKLADFGLARALDSAGLTPDGIVKGKLAYLAPELLRGTAPTPQSDLFSVGILLWEVFAGRRRYGGMKDGEIVQALVRGDPPAPLETLNPDVPEPLRAVVTRAVSPDPAQRFPNASAFARTLSDILRRIPERTDATRIHREVTTAMEALRRLRARQRTATPSTLGAPAAPPNLLRGRTLPPAGSAPQGPPAAGASPPEDRASIAIPLVQGGSRRED
jgi:serine/threonine-protein kinase